MVESGFSALVGNPQAATQAPSIQRVSPSRGGSSGTARARAHSGSGGAAVDQARWGEVQQTDRLAPPGSAAHSDNASRRHWDRRRAMRSSRAAVGRYPTRSSGPGFGEVEPRLPGSEIDHRRSPKQWTLQRILEAHRANQSDHAEHSDAAMPGSSLGMQAEAAERPLSSKETHDYTATRLQEQSNTDLDILSRLRPVAHRWGEAPPKPVRQHIDSNEHHETAHSGDIESADEETELLQSSTLYEGNSKDKDNGAELQAESRVRSSRQRVSDFARRMSSCGTLEEMLHQFEAAVVSGEKIVTHDIYIITRRLGLEGKITGIHQVLQRSRELGLPPLVSSYKHMAKACGIVKSFYALREVLPAYLQAGLELTRAMLDAIIRACGPCSRIEYAWDIVHLMEAAGIQPDINTLNCILDMYAEAKLPENAETIFRQLESFGLKPNVVTYAAVAKAWSKVGDVPKIRAVIDEEQRNCGQASLASWAALVTAQAARGDTAEAQHVVDELRLKLPPSQLLSRFTVGMYVSLIAAYSRAGEVGAAECALRDAEALGGKATTPMYATIISGHHKAADLDSCFRLADEAEAKGVPLGRAGETLLVEAIMEAWQQRGRPADILQVAAARFERALLRHWPTQLKGTGFKSRAPEGSQIDLHSLTPWSAQLMLLHFLKTIAGRIDDGWEFPKADMTIITGRGNHSPNKSSLVRDVTLRFLQSMFSPRLAYRNEGIVVIKRWELLSFLVAVKREGHSLEPHIFQDSFVASSSFASPSS